MSERFVSYRPENRVYEEEFGGKKIRCSVVHATFTHLKKEYLIKSVLRYRDEKALPTESIHSIMEARVPFNDEDPAAFARKYLDWVRGHQQEWHVRLLSSDSSEFVRVATAFMHSRGQRL
ncbi:hypothetical protein H0O03_01345 [Candidatus Micrarchaeota archaeon]|nr:hypothetical protein [Candidatus Micrarchaeota archaeon]